jgi:hypothetical protein
MKKYSEATKIKRAERCWKLHSQRREYLNKIKLASGCIDCPKGTFWPPEALQFDHIDPSKKRCQISWVTCAKWDRILEEVKKCVIRCANHHFIKTARERAEHRRFQPIAGFSMNEQKKDELTDDEVMDLEIGMGPF